MLENNKTTLIESYIMQHPLLNKSTTPTHTSLLIEERVSLADKNWFQTGGAARFFCQPRTEAEFIQALTFAHTKKIPIFVLGSGANVLISDEGFNGLVIRPALTQCDIVEKNNDYTFVRAGAGLTIDALIAYCLNNQLLGLEEFSGIPGTVGGAVFINLHYFEFLLSDFLVHAQVINATTGTLMEVDAAWFQFGYNQSALQTNAYYLLSATFKVGPASPAQTCYARGRRTEIIRHRLARYPTQRTCGSFFRNFHPDEVTIMSHGKKMIYVAYYLDKIGIKGELQRGGAIVSYQHANMVVTQAGATSTDIITLARVIQEAVHTNFNILPQPECRLVGFSKYPLH